MPELADEYMLHGGKNFGKQLQRRIYSLNITSVWLSKANVYFIYLYLDFKRYSRLLNFHRNINLFVSYTTPTLTVHSAL